MKKLHLRQIALLFAALTIMLGSQAAFAQQRPPHPYHNPGATPEDFLRANARRYGGELQREETKGEDGGRSLFIVYNDGMIRVETYFPNDRLESFLETDGHDNGIYELRERNGGLLRTYSHHNQPSVTYLEMDDMPSHVTIRVGDVVRFMVAYRVPHPRYPSITVQPLGVLQIHAHPPVPMTPPQPYQDNGFVMLQAVHPGTATISLTRYGPTHSTVVTVSP